ncbi:MAG: M6 family metalloprotease domain-containing protein [Dysgonamonadaceae bacterium]|nr:M6 family metalloprotease domain-containing protein [Dysgonamonadaceae bacterium]
MKRLNILLSVLFFMPVLVKAVPARPTLVDLTQPDGRTVQVYIRGDEKIRWLESPDGYSLLYGEDNFIVYAVADENGDMIPSDIVYSDASLRSSTEEAGNIPKKLKFSSKQISEKHLAWDKHHPKRESTKNLSSLRQSNAKTRALCVLMEFPDKKFKKGKQDFEALMNQSGYSASGAKGSVHDFFIEDSYGQVDLEITVLGPFTADHNMEYYGKDSGGVGQDARPRELAEEAAYTVHEYLGTDISVFDNDGNGFIDAFHVIYAGYGQEGGGETNTIWAHEAWFLWDLVLGSVKLSNYSCSPELHSNKGEQITNIGVICHEMGHILGSPDFYDTDGGNDEYVGTGKWDLMANGSWNGNGTSPANTNMYQKIANGWVTPVELTETSTVTGMDNSAEHPVAFKISTPVDGDYFILENRQQKNFDSYVPGHGLLIYHVSLTKQDIFYNTVNNSHPQKMYPVCASASGNPGNGSSTYGNINSMGCPFPGSTGKTSFTNETTPSLVAWNGQNANGKITGITEIDGKISFNFTLTGNDIQQLAGNRAIVFPNPVSRGEYITVHTETERSILSVFSIYGEKISEETVDSGLIRKRIDMLPGIYLIKLSENGKPAVFKLTVK